ncbi:MAG: hypothetical protein KF789_07990 [Bdellovibrionaceae bacterium]|nr:hypothetical protein [Pseudobdellovibrionaceae bacterium]
MSAESFARRHQVRLRTLYRWLAAYRKSPLWRDSKSPTRQPAQAAPETVRHQLPFEPLKT